MYVIILHGGKQYKARENELIKIERVHLELGQCIEFNNILTLSYNNQVKVGTPYVLGCKVIGVLQQHLKADKINILKFKRRKHHMKHMGHRQMYSEIKITKIECSI